MADLVTSPLAASLAFASTQELLLARTGLIDPEPAARFTPLPLRQREPSELDANPRFLRLQGFRSRFLPTRRDLFVYLPEAYLTQPEARFPVFYLHDGQNLFDGRTSYVPGKTWRAHTAADRLTAEGLIEPVILVGIANTGVRRMAEYTPTADPRLGGGAGARYGSLLVEELKPLIDAAFRTRAGREDTALGGSSLGGLISLALGLEHPEIFGKLAVLSPSVWWDHRSILNLVRSFRSAPALRSLALRSATPRFAVSHSTAVPRPRIWLDMGTAEGLRHLRDTDLLHRRLQLRGWTSDPSPAQDLCYLRVPGGLHEESAWAARFPQVLKFLFPPRAVV